MHSRQLEIWKGISIWKMVYVIIVLLSASGTSEGDTCHCGDKMTWTASSGGKSSIYELSSLPCQACHCCCLYLNCCLVLAAYKNLLRTQLSPVFCEERVFIESYPWYHVWACFGHDTKGIKRKKIILNVIFVQRYHFEILKQGSVVE